MESWQGREQAMFPSQTHTSQAHAQAEPLFTLCAPVLPSGTSCSGALPPAAVFVFTSSPLGLRGQSAWMSAEHSWPSCLGLPSGTESLLKAATHPLLPLYPSWCWAGFTWGRPKKGRLKRAPTAGCPRHLCRWVPLAGSHFSVMIITCGVVIPTLQMRE